MTDMWRGRKLTDFPKFLGQGILLEAQELGVKATDCKLDATAATLIGLVQLLIKRGVISEDGYDWE